MITVLEATEQVTTIPEGLANTALGMGTVFAVLILISFIIYLLKFVPGSPGEKRQRESGRRKGTGTKACTAGDCTRSEYR